jgi:hypothetical protein
MHIIEDKASGKPQDDRNMHMEEIMQVSNARNQTPTITLVTVTWQQSDGVTDLLQLVAALPTKSANRVELTSLFLDELWNSLEVRRSVTNPRIPETNSPTASSAVVYGWRIPV